MEKIILECYHLQRDGGDTASGSHRLNCEAAATLLVAKKIEEQTAVMKELIREIVALMNQR